MSKTIEFIEQATIANQRRLEQYKKDLEYYQKDVSLIDHGAKIFQLKHDIEHIEKIVLPNLQQIKAELETWEVVKKFIIDSNGVYLLRLDSDDYDNEYYQTHKKALEVE